MVTEKTIRQLIDKEGSFKITLSLPTYKVGDDRQQNPIRFKNLLSSATEKLKQAGLKENAVTELLKPARDLLQQPLFWSAMEHGMVTYLTDAFMEIFKLPYETEETVYVSDHFWVTPLLPMISINGTYCILAVSQEKIRLLRCTRADVTNITPRAVQISVNDWLEVKPEPQIQFHTGGKEGGRAQFFGHGSTEEDKKEITQVYFREMEKELTAALKKINDPLLLAGLKTNTALYRKINGYGRVLEKSIKQNPDTLTDTQLREMGWSFIKDHFLKDLYEAIRLFGESPEERVSRDPSEIIAATVMGKSEAIFVTKDLVKWGRYDHENHQVLFTNRPGNDDVDLMNWLSIKGLERGSRVYVLPQNEMPDHAQVAALYRY